MHLTYLGFSHQGQFVPVDTLWNDKEDFHYVEKKRPVLVTNNPGLA